MPILIDRPALRRRIEAELCGNILPFWMNYAMDKTNGGFYGAVTNDRQVQAAGPRSAIVCGRILWTYATACRILKDEKYLPIAEHAYHYLTQVFWDQAHDGVYWSVDQQGQPVSDRKHHYAQAFALYGLSEYYRATQTVEGLQYAQRLFQLLETHGYDPAHGGYIEGSGRQWNKLDDMRLSAREINCRKSMNTLLHILEAYTNLLRIWDDSQLKQQHRNLIDIFNQRVIDPQTQHFKLFFDDPWHSLSNLVSFGHDIEGSWLLVEAAQVQGNPARLAQVRQTAAKMAEAVYQAGRDPDGCVLYEAGPDGIENFDKHWWVQAEAVVGFYNAYQLSGQEHFAAAALQVWNYIEAKFVDRVDGDWYKVLDKNGTPYADHLKVGPWECPYHHSRTCFEMLDRLQT